MRAIWIAVAIAAVSVAFAARAGNTYRGVIVHSCTQAQPCR